MTCNNVYLVNAEAGIPLFKHAVQTLGATISTSVLAYNAGSDETNLDIVSLDTLFLISQTNVEVYKLADGDCVIFEMPVFGISQEIATGMSIYMANIGTAIGDEAVINVQFYSRILGN